MTSFKGTSLIEISDEGFTSIRITAEINNIKAMKLLTPKPELIVKTTFLNESKDKWEI